MNTFRDKSKFIRLLHTVLDNKAFISIDPNYISGFTIGSTIGLN